MTIQVISVMAKMEKHDVADDGATELNSSRVNKKMCMKTSQKRGSLTGSKVSGDLRSRDDINRKNEPTRKTRINKTNDDNSNISLELDPLEETLDPLSSSKYSATEICSPVLFTNGYSASSIAEFDSHFSPEISSTNSQNVPIFNTEDKVDQDHDDDLISGNQNQIDKAACRMSVLCNDDDTKGIHDMEHLNNKLLVTSLNSIPITDKGETVPGPLPNKTPADSYTNHVTDEVLSLDGFEDTKNIIPCDISSSDQKGDSDNLLCEEKSTSLDPLLLLSDAALEEKEIRQQMASFELITENEFLCERRPNKQSQTMECECTLTKAEIKQGVIGCGEDCLNRLLMIECGRNCALKKHCGNKKFQNAENARTEIFKTKFKGIGVRALEDIPPDTFIMEYVGEVMNQKLFRKRAKKYAKDDDAHFYFMAISSETFIDAHNKGNISRFINHSCDPVAETQKWTVDEEIRIGFFSKRKVLKGEEITFDYKYERYGQQAQKCFCGSLNCRQWLGQKPSNDVDTFINADFDSDVSSSSTDDESSNLKEKSNIGHKRLELSTSISKYEDKRQRRYLNPLRSKKYRSGHGSRIGDGVKEDGNDEIEQLRVTGIRTKSHTVHLCRLMVRSTDTDVRITLLELLKGADTPCRRLFIDYQGLKILQKWMAVLESQSLSDLSLIVAIQDALMVLTIPHKTILVNCGIWQTLKLWAEDKLSFESVDLYGVKDDVNEPTSNNPTDSSFIAVQMDRVINNARKLLDTWSGLKEMFTIPKRELIALRVEHERQADLAAAARANSRSGYNNVLSTSNSSSLLAWNHQDSPPSRTSRFDRVGCPTVKMATTKRCSRFDDRSGLLHKSNLSREDRRKLFTMKAMQEEDEKKKRELQMAEHERKCYYLGLDPKVTPMFPHVPDFFFDRHQCQWFPLPKEKSPVNVTWGYPTSATNLPSEAYRDTDPPPPDPAYFYPPGVVSVSYIYGPPFYAHGGIMTNEQNPSTPYETVISSDHSISDLPLNTHDSPKQLDESGRAPLPIVRIQLPPKWKTATDAEGRIYYYHSKTRVSQWEPPSINDEETLRMTSSKDQGIEHEKDIVVVDMDVVSTDSEELREEVEDTDDEDEESSGLSAQSMPPSYVNMTSSSTFIEEDKSDLSVIEKEIIQAKRKTKEERQHERRQKRERDREKREYERRRRQERHGKHRQDGLVQEHLIPGRTEAERSAKNLKLSEYSSVVNVATTTATDASEPDLPETDTENVPAAQNNVCPMTEIKNTAPDLERKLKVKFMKESSRVIVKLLDSYMRTDAVTARIESSEHFKHLAKKLTQFVLTKELKRCVTIDKLQCTDSVKKKVTEFVKKYMSKFGEVYCPSP